MARKPSITAASVTYILVRLLRSPIAGLSTPLNRIIEIIKARSEEMSLNATVRTFNVSQKSIIDFVIFEIKSYDKQSIINFG
jgi:hypothetical protein